MIEIVIDYMMYIKKSKNGDVDSRADDLSLKFLKFERLSLLFDLSRLRSHRIILERIVVDQQ